MRLGQLHPFPTNLCFAIVVRSEKLWILAMTTTTLAYGLVWMALYRIGAQNPKSYSSKV